MSCLGLSIAIFICDRTVNKRRNQISIRGLKRKNLHQTKQDIDLSISKSICRRQIECNKNDHFSL